MKSSCSFSLKIFFPTLALLCAAFCLTACHKQKTQTPQMPVYNRPDPPVWTFNSDSVELGTRDFYTFDIERDYSPLKERLWTDPKKKVYVENSHFKDSVHIEFRGGTALVDCCRALRDCVQVNGAHVTVRPVRNVACTLTGRSQNGSLRVLGGDGKVRINLQGVSLHSAQGPAIDCRTRGTCFLVTDKASCLSDDSLYRQRTDSLRPRGCVCTRGKLAISGPERLRVTGRGADAVHAGRSLFVRRGADLDIESHGGNALKAKNNVFVEGGRINILSLTPGCSGIVARREVTILGGRTVIVSETGDGRLGKNARGIKCDSLVTIRGGIVRVKDTSRGGKGIRAGYRFSAKNCIIDILTSGYDDKQSGSKNRAIKGADEVRIDSSRIRIRSVNGWSEGLSSNRQITISNSLVELVTRDDGISAGESHQSDITVDNSRIYSDAGMDCIDAYTLHMNSGIFFVFSHSNGSRAFDCDHNEFRIGPDALLVGLSDATSEPTESLLQHPACYLEQSQRHRQFCLVEAGSRQCIVSFHLPDIRYKAGTYHVMLSVPQFRQNVAYDFSRETVAAQPVHTFHELRIGGTLTSASSSASSSASTDRHRSRLHTFTRNYTTL